MKTTDKDADFLTAMWRFAGLAFGVTMTTVFATAFLIGLELYPFAVCTGVFASLALMAWLLADFFSRESTRVVIERCERTDPNPHAKDTNQ